ENFLAEFFKDHPKTEKSDFKNFYNIQIVWDEAMAENINKFFKNHMDYTMVVLAGNGHIMYSYGIPERSYRRNNIEFVTILNDTGHKKGISDFVIYSKEENFH
ncbi:MAG: ChaN family lipoprotein, partial [Thermodesulfobacteriota bacterium]